MLLKLDFHSTKSPEHYLWGHIYEPACDIEQIKTHPENFHGEFGLIFKSDKDEWSIIRDKVGIQPIYYYLHSKDQLWICDSYGELFHAIKSPQIDLDYLENTRKYNFKDKTSTACKQIKRALPASITRIKSLNVHSQLYWRPTNIKIQDYDIEQWLQKSHRCFDQIIKDKLIKPSEFGVLWSGGIDSTAIILKASQHTNQASALSFICKDQNLTGGQIHDKIKSVSHLKHIDFAYESKPIDFYFPRDEEAKSGILYSPTNILGARVLYQKAKEQGVQWIAHGYGPDYIFDPPFTFWSTRLGFRSLGAFIKSLSVYGFNFGKKEAVKELFKVFFFMSPKPLQKFILKRHRPELAEIEKDLRLRYLESSLLSNGDLQHGIEQMQELAKLYGIKLTFPYLDTRFLELATQTPIELFWANKMTKPAFRLFASQFMPASIANFQTQQDYRPFSLRILGAFQKAFWPEELPNLPPVNDNINQILADYNFWKSKNVFGEHNEKEKNL